MIFGFRWRFAAPVALLLSLAHTALAQQVPHEDPWAVRPNPPVLDRSGILPNSTALIKSLGDAAEYVLRWQPPANAAAWKTRRPEVERAFRRAIGLDNLPLRTPLKPRITARHDRRRYVVENVVFESRPGFPVTANLYRPKRTSSEKLPAIVNPIGHYLGPGKTHPDVQSRCIKLAQMGFMVLIYDAIGHGERMIPGNIHHEAGYALLPSGETIAGWMVWDSMRAIDYLLTLEDVDPARIGITGNSGGGLNTLFTAALDPRVRAAAVVGYTFDFNNWIKYAGAHCTCTHLPAVYRHMEWFEIAGLIAPRALMMLQGGSDNIFPIEGARRAARKTAAVYDVLGQPRQVIFGELPGLPHAYSRPYRERMYGWMALHLLKSGGGGPLDEGEVEPLPAGDPRLLCDPDRSFLPQSKSVLEFAREKGTEAISRFRNPNSPEARETLRRWIAELTAPPEAMPHNLMPSTGQKVLVPGGTMEKVSFLSEEGQYIPGLLWLPGNARSPARVVIIVDDRGKGSVAESGLVQPLVDSGYAVFSIDLRGRGETLGHYRPTRDTNFRFVANQVLFGRPAAGRRAFDLTRAVDYLQRRQLPAEHLAVVGLGDDALPALLAAAADSRFRNVVVARYFHSFVSQMRAMGSRKMPDSWNDAQQRGRLYSDEYEVDFGAVIPFSLNHGDIPDIASALAPRRLLFCEARDNGAADLKPVRSRFQSVTAAIAENPVRYEPGRALDSTLLLEWLRESQ